jgi:hypothetical protein
VDIFGIAPVVLKLAPDVLAVPLTWLINNIIQEGEIPQAWKEGRVLPFHKKREKSKVENYRPVCIMQKTLPPFYLVFPRPGADYVAPGKNTRASLDEVATSSHLVKRLESFLHS